MPAGSKFRKPEPQTPRPLWPPTAIRTRQTIAASLQAARVPPPTCGPALHFVRRLQIESFRQRTCSISLLISKSQSALAHPQSTAPLRPLLSPPHLLCERARNTAEIQQQTRAQIPRVRQSSEVSREKIYAAAS